MGTLFEDLQQGLQEAIDYEKGIGKARTIIICFRIILIVECGMLDYTSLQFCCSLLRLYHDCTVKFICF